MKSTRFLTISLVISTMAVPAAAQQDFSGVTIQTIPVARGIFMLKGAGGNIGLSVGADGAFIVDDQYAPLTDRIKVAIAAQTTGPVRFVVNTHWHADHTEGNEHMGEGGAIIIAHDNVRKRMSTQQFIAAFGDTVPPSPKGALPVVTFADGVTFHWNGDEIRVFHVAPAHTDGDAVIHFVGANVIHAGDLYFNGMYPFIDVSSGGRLSGVIAAVDRILQLAGPATKIIPGHGAVSGRAELVAYRGVLVTTRARIGKMLAAGKSREAVIAAKPMREYDATWGQGFIKPDVWVGTAYDALRAERAKRKVS